MSYDSQVAHMELDEIISKAVREDDDETLYKWADVIAETDPEFASHIRSLAQKAEDNNWSYDRERDNNL